MPIFLSNPSRQTVVFYYRDPRLAELRDSRTFRPDSRSIDLRHVIIRPGQQELLNPPPGAGDWTVQEIADLVEQLERFGGREATETHGQMTKFTGLIYSINRVVTENEIAYGHEAVLETAHDRSVATATRAALAVDRTLRHPTDRNQPPVRATQVVVEEDRRPWDRDRKNGVAMSLEVTPDGRADVVLPQ